MNETGHSKPVNWDNPEGWDGERGGREDWEWGTHVHPWLIHVNVWQTPLQYCKVISLQLIKINGKKKNKGTTRKCMCLCTFVQKETQEIKAKK